MSAAKQMDLQSWIVYAIENRHMTIVEAQLVWYKENNIGKKVICECWDDKDSDKSGTRMYIYKISPPTIDEINCWWCKYWNMFTISKDKVKEGCYLCEVVDYRFDKRANVICEVKVISLINDTNYSELRQSEYIIPSNATLQLMVSDSDVFIRNYSFSFKYALSDIFIIKGTKDPNYDELRKKYPVFENLSLKKIGEKLFQMYINKEITINEIEEILSTPSEYQKRVNDITNFIYSKSIDESYFDKYPLLMEKIPHNVSLQMSAEFTRIKVDQYIERQFNCYKQLVAEGKMKPVEGDTLDLVEAVLVYRKAQKAAEKEERKKVRKEKK